VREGVGVYATGADDPKDGRVGGGRREVQVGIAIRQDDVEGGRKIVLRVGRFVEDGAKTGAAAATGGKYCYRSE